MSTEAPGPGDVFVGMIEARVLAKVQARVAELETRLASLEGSRCATPCVRLNEACKLFDLSRPTFNRWLADPCEGLEEGPEPVVIRPNGPGGKVLVHVARMQAWLDARAARPSRPRRRA